MQISQVQPLTKKIQYVFFGNRDNKSQFIIKKKMSNANKIDNNKNAKYNIDILDKLKKGNENIKNKVKVYKCNLFRFLVIINKI